ncbi:hypothetical protein Pfo_027316 [Paulownia fortunei]|nr:hypothetical protein Pfo_027316 [Paulownia fortunei]
MCLATGTSASGAATSVSLGSGATVGFAPMFCTTEPTVGFYKLRFFISSSPFGSSYAAISKCTSNSYKNCWMVLKPWVLKRKLGSQRMMMHNLRWMKIKSPRVEEN